jgi:hypothetical protein
MRGTIQTLLETRGASETSCKSIPPRLPNSRTSLSTFVFSSSALKTNGKNHRVTPKDFHPGEFCYVLCYIGSDGNHTFFCGENPCGGFWEASAYHTAEEAIRKTSEILQVHNRYEILCYRLTSGYEYERTHIQDGRYRILESIDPTVALEKAKYVYMARRLK